MKRVLRDFLSLWLVVFLLCVASASAQELKNVILLIGDGMGPDHVQAARLMAGGELAMDRLDDAPGQVTTVNYFGKVTDSAAAATALATGVKTANGNISMDWTDTFNLETVLERAEAFGKATGLVTNVYLQDATPGVWAAHWVSRNGREIARQQADGDWGYRVEVLLGSGRYYMLPKGKLGGSRRDGRNLIEDMVGYGYRYVDTVDDLNAVNDMSGYTGLLGIFGSIWTVEYVLDRDSDLQHSPSLPEMAAKAIEVLSEYDDDGFFLVIEGGAIDWMAHNRDIAGVVAETLEFDACVDLALDFAEDDGETLVVVTADHETGDLDSDGVNLDFLSGIARTTEFMWGLIHKGKMPIEDVMWDYAGIDLTEEELEMIELYGEGGMSDVLSARAGVSWGWSGSDGGNHTDRQVEVYAYGPGAWKFDSITDNTDIGILLFDAVMGIF